MSKGNKARDFLKRALAGATIGALAFFLYFFFTCDVLSLYPCLGAGELLLIALIGAIAGVMTSFFGSKLPSPDDEA